MICSSLYWLFLIVLLPFFSQQNSPFVTSSFSGSGHRPVQLFVVSSLDGVFYWLDKPYYLPVFFCFASVSTSKGQLWLYLLNNTPPTHTDTNAATRPKSPTRRSGTPAFRSARTEHFSHRQINPAQFPFLMFSLVAGLKEC